MQLSNRVARLSISGCRHRTSIHDHNISRRRFRSARASAFKQLPLEGRPVRLRRAATELFNIKGRHSNLRGMH
jgi:hypothetical protein